MRLTTTTYRWLSGRVDYTCWMGIWRALFIDYLEEDEDVLDQQGLDIIREYTLSNMDGMFSLLALIKS